MKAKKGHPAQPNMLKYAGIELNKRRHELLMAAGGTMGRFMSLWAMSFRNEPLLVSHPGPLNALNPKQKELFARMWLNEAPVPRLYRPLRGNGLSYMRFLVPSDTIQRVQNECSLAARTSDIVVALMWKRQREYAVLADQVAYPRITFLEDLRQHIPQLQPFSGNLIRFLPPLVPEPADGEGTAVGASLLAQPLTDQLNTTTPTLKMGCQYGFPHY